MVDKTLLNQALCGRHGKVFAEKMARAHVAVAGLGGLGSNVAVMLVRMGIGHLHLIDYDRVDISNLNRQQYTVADIGRYKTEVLQKYLLQINPYVDIKADCLKLSAGNIVEVLARDEIVCEALDAPDAKAMLVNEVLTVFTDKKVVAASGMAGLGSANDVVTRKISDRLYICGDGRSDCSKMPLTAARVALCAAHQANIISRIILGLE